MVKGFVRLTGKYSGDGIYIQASSVKAVMSLKSLPAFDRMTEGSAVYLNENSVYENNYLCVLESTEKVMKLIEEAENGN